MIDEKCEKRPKNIPSQNYKWLTVQDHEMRLLRKNNETPRWGKESRRESGEHASSTVDENEKHGEATALPRGEYGDSEGGGGVKRKEGERVVEPKE